MAPSEAVRKSPKIQKKNTYTKRRYCKTFILLNQDHCRIPIYMDSPDIIDILVKASPEITVYI